MSTRQLLLGHTVTKTDDELVSICSVVDNMANCTELDDEFIVDELEGIIENAPVDVLDSLSLYYRTGRLTTKQRQVLDNFYILYHSIALGLQGN